MALSIGIVGLPNVGKSTLFNTLTKKKAEASNYPFCTIDPNVGVVKVPDERLYKLAEVAKSKKIIPTTIEFVDIAGLVKGASTGEGLGNKFLANIRECDAICEVVRNFENDDIIHVHGKIDPEDDRETINMELIMADLQSVSKKLDRATKDSKSGDKDIIKLRDILAGLKEHLDQGLPAREFALSEDDKLLVRDLNLLSIKPIIYVVNSDEESEVGKNWDGQQVTLNVKLEEEIASLPEEEQEEYIKELGLDDSGLNKLIKASYNLLELITYFTVGPEEARAWTIEEGTKAPQAAGVIHTDFEKGFVRAEAIMWDKYIEMGGESAAREKGLIRIEGKEYVVQDGDSLHFLHNK